MMTLKEKKDSQRERLKNRRDTFFARASKDRLARFSSLYLQVFTSSAEYAKYRRFISFMPLPNEPDISLINSLLQQEGKKLLLILPKITAPIPDDLNFEAILVPTLGFDRQGNRMGQGKGWYDRFLAKLEAYNPNICKIGVSFSNQEVGNLKKEDTDIKMSRILTEKEMIEIPYSKKINDEP